MLHLIRKFVYEGVEVSATGNKINGVSHFLRLAVLAYLRRVFVRSSIGGYVKFVRVEEVIASGDVW